VDVFKIINGVGEFRPGTVKAFEELFALRAEGIVLAGRSLR
jgi:hypothetical protein